jgi:transcription elongation factor Elf1
VEAKERGIALGSNNTKPELLPELPDNLNARLVEFHCGRCGRFLGLQAIVEGTVVVWCGKCKDFNILDVRQGLTNIQTYDSIGAKVEKTQ